MRDATRSLRSRAPTPFPSRAAGRRRDVRAARRRAAACTRAAHGAAAALQHAARQAPGPRAHRLGA
eukprot:scaffold15645_cov53-Phaeocystis_antarctica.AAC.2